VLRGAGLALVQLRSYDRADADRIRAMSARLSPHSMYRRFFNGTPELEDARVEAARARQRVGMLRRLGVDRVGWTSVDRRPDLGWAAFSLALLSVWTSRTGLLCSVGLGSIEQILRIPAPWS
jgi:hypothetical protein